MATQRMQAGVWRAAAVPKCAQFVSSAYEGPIHSLEFVTERIVLCGQGSMVHAYDIKTGRFLLSQCVLPCSRIHRIRLEASSHWRRVALFGQKQIYAAEIVVEYDDAEPECPVRVSLADLFSLKMGDRVLNCEWLRSDSSIQRNDVIAIALAHNYVEIWSAEPSPRCLSRAQSAEHCLLYSSAFYGATVAQLTIASGTVFNEVQLWQLDDRVQHQVVTGLGGQAVAAPVATFADFPVIKRLLGHEGVIFAISFLGVANMDSPDTHSPHILCSVSDDRSIRVWDVSGRGLPTGGGALTKAHERVRDARVDGDRLVTVLSTQVSGVAQRSTASASQLGDGCIDAALVMYGHGARVWDVRLTPRYIVTIAEDSTGCVWSYDGVRRAVWAGHEGKSVWALAVDPTGTLAATGGGDSAIRTWELSRVGTADADHKSPREKEVDLCIPPVDESVVRALEARAAAVPPAVADADDAVTAANDSADAHVCDAAVDDDDALRRRPTRAKPDMPRSVCVVGDGRLLISAVSGVLFFCELGGNSSDGAALSDSADTSGLVPGASVAQGPAEGIESPGAAAFAWTPIYFASELATYQVIAADAALEVVALGSVGGAVHVAGFGNMSGCRPARVAFHRAKVTHMYVGRMAGCNARDAFELGTCSTGGDFVWQRVFVSPDSAECASLSVTAIARFTLPASAIAQSFCVAAGGALAVCGDRDGNVHILSPPHASAANDPLANPCTPSFTLSKVHGKESVTSLRFGGDGLLYSTGRNGYYCSFALVTCADGTVTLEPQLKHKFPKGMEWLDRLIFADASGNSGAAVPTLLLGFHRTDFVVWDLVHNRYIFKQNCGGGHRGYDFWCGDVSVSAYMFAYIRMGAVKVHVLAQERGDVSSLSLVKRPFHGREVSALCIGGCIARKSGATSTIVFSGGEDRGVVVSELCTDGPHVHFVRRARLEGHTSNIRAMTFLRTEFSDEALSGFLFSGGGKETLRCWSVGVRPSSDAGDPNSLKVDCTSFAANDAVSEGTVPVDSRIMGVIVVDAASVTCAVEKECGGSDASLASLSAGDAKLRHIVPVVYIADSDGSIAAFALNSKRKLVKFARGEYHSGCTLSIATAACDGIAGCVLFSGSTDGRICVWDARPTARQALAAAGTLDQRKLRMARMSPVAVLRAHQSGVNCIAVALVSAAAVTGDDGPCVRATFRIVSGGDDNALFVASIEVILLGEHIAEKEGVSVTVPCAARVVGVRCARHPAAHGSSVKGVCFLGTSSGVAGSEAQVVSISTDQRVIVWRIEPDTLEPCDAFVTPPLSSPARHQRTDTTTYCDPAATDASSAGARARPHASNATVAMSQDYLFPCGGPQSGRFPLDGPSHPDCLTMLQGVFAEVCDASALAANDAGSILVIGGVGVQVLRRPNLLSVKK